MNRWLEATHNYECAGGDCNNLVLAAPGAGHLPGSALEFISEAPKPAASQMAADLAAGTVVYIAHVRKNSHFVLLTQAADKTAKRFRANDPYFNEKSYAYTDMSDVITYKVLPHVEPVACVDTRSPSATENLLEDTDGLLRPPLRRSFCFLI